MFRRRSSSSRISAITGTALTVVGKDARVEPVVAASPVVVVVVVVVAAAAAVVVVGGGRREAIVITGSRYFFWSGNRSTTVLTALDDATHATSTGFRARGVNRGVSRLLSALRGAFFSHAAEN